MIAPRHWAEDRVQTWEEWSAPHGVRCMDCDVLLTHFAMTERRLLPESAVEISFSEEPVIPMYEIVCTKCAEEPGKMVSDWEYEGEEWKKPS